MATSRGARERAKPKTRPAPSWLVLRVVLLGKADREIDPPPGRELLVSRQHTFADLAGAIDRAFARWDRSHLHLFYWQTADASASRATSGSCPTCTATSTSTLGTSTSVTTPSAWSGSRKGETFEYVFDLGDEWMHECVVIRDQVDPVEEYGGSTRSIVPIFGWGVIPDQYGRRRPDDEGDEDDRTPAGRPERRQITRRAKK